MSTTPEKTALVPPDKPAAPSASPSHHHHSSTTAAVASTRFKLAAISITVIVLLLVLVTRMTGDTTVPRGVRVKGAVPNRSDVIHKLVEDAEKQAYRNKVQAGGAGEIFWGNQNQQSQQQQQGQGQGGGDGNAANTNNNAVNLPPAPETPVPIVDGRQVPTPVPPVVFDVPPVAPSSPPQTANQAGAATTTAAASGNSKKWWWQKSGGAAGDRLANTPPPPPPSSPSSFNNKDDEQEMPPVPVLPPTRPYTMDDLQREMNRTLITGINPPTRGVLRLKFEPLVSRKTVKIGTEYHQRYMNCTRKSSQEAGYYWKYSGNGECKVLEGFYAPLQSFEVSSQELSCSDDSFFETAYKGQQEKSGMRWVKFGFRGFTNTTGVLDRFGLDKSWIRALKEEYDRYKEQETTAAAPPTTTSTKAPTTTATNTTSKKRKRKQSNGNNEELDSDGDAAATPPSTAAPTTTTTPPPTTTAAPKRKAAIDIALERRYSRFMFFTSWLFRQYLPWKPLPRLTYGRSGDFDYRGWHDGGSENVYRIKNFCIDPVSGALSGLNPRSDGYIGKDDTRNKFHGEREWTVYWTNVKRLEGKPLAFDERPVLFVPAMPLSRHNLAHLTMKMMSTIGILDMPVFGASGSDYWKPDGEPKQSEFVPGSGTEHWNRAGGVKPLLVFLYSTQPPNEDANRDISKVTAWAMWLRALDLPWAVINIRPDREDWMRQLWKMAEHSGGALNNPNNRGTGSPEPRFVQNPSAAATAAMTTTVAASTRTNNNSTGDDGGDPPIVRPPPTTPPSDDSSLFYDKRLRFIGGPEMCFRRAAVWMTCFGCESGRPQGDDQEFSWGNWARLNAPKIAIARHYMQLLHNCLPFPRKNAYLGPGAMSAKLPGGRYNSDYPAPAFSEQFYQQLPPEQAAALQVSRPAVHSSSAADLSVPKPDAELPRVFLLVRTRVRGWTNLPTLIDRIYDLAKDFVSEIAVREPWRGSRASYLDEMRSSDVWVGVHGGAAAETMLLRPRAAMVEWILPHNSCPGPEWDNGGGASCWMRPFSEVARGSHWIMQMSGQQDSSMLVQPWMIADSIKDAVCRWYNMNPQRRNPSQRVKLYCGRMSDGKKFRSLNFANMQGNLFAADLFDVQRLLRRNFGMKMEDSAAIELMERIRSLGKNKDQFKNVLRSEAPRFFKELLQRFVSNEFEVIGKVKEVREIFDNNERRRGIEVNGRWMPLEPVVCLIPVYGDGRPTEQPEWTPVPTTTAPPITNENGTIIGYPPPPRQIPRMSKRLCLYFASESVSDPEKRENA